MSFIQAEFVALMAAVLVVYWNVGRRAQGRLLIVSSAVFYGWIHPWFLALLYGSALLDFAMAQLMVVRPEQRRLWLACSLAGNLGLLGAFKYLDFFLVNIASTLASLGLSTSMGTLGLILPVGISFYSFQTLSYTLDVYRGQIAPRRSLEDYLVFISFFPQLVAGPIERASNLLPQVETRRVFDPAQVWSGLHLALWGAFKKVCIADVLAPYVDKVFVLEDPGGPVLWAATLAFMIQLLADFSGYTDIARGTARMLGFELMANFDHPYLATSPQSFWRRWHISLSSWIRDYLYRPLRGAEGGPARRAFAVMAAMVLSGLWHGASWNFVLWGALHGALLLLWRVVTPRIPQELRGSPVGAVTGWICFTSVLFVSFFLFRERSLARIVVGMSTPPWSGTAAEWMVAEVILATCAMTATPLFVALLWERYMAGRLQGSPWRFGVDHTLRALWLIAVLTFVVQADNDFVYFAF